MSRQPSPSSRAGAQIAVNKEVIKDLEKKAKATEDLFASKTQEQRDLTASVQSDISKILGEGTEAASQFANYMTAFGETPSPSEQIATYQQRLQADIPILNTPSYQRTLGALDRASQQYETTVKKGLDEIPMRFARAGKDPNANLLLDPNARDLARGQLSIQPEFTRYNV